MCKSLIRIMIILIAMIAMQVSAVYSRTYKYRIVDIESISRYDEDRMAFQRIETEPQQFVAEQIDNSIECLLIIKGKKVYLFKDGYDNPDELKYNTQVLDTERKLIPDIWINKIDGNPDYLRITERRIELLKNMTVEFVSKNYKDNYIKWRNDLIKRHVDIFRSLIINRKESGFYVERKRLPKKSYESGPPKYSITASGKTPDEKLYYAEDTDGDGLTETFAVSISDGFHWGFESGPNVVFIYKCKYTDENNKEKNSDFKNLIGNLTNEAYFGSPTEEKIIRKTFPKDSDINNLIDDIYTIDPNFKKVMDDHAVTEK